MVFVVPLVIISSFRFQLASEMLMHMANMNLCHVFEVAGAEDQLCTEHPKLNTPNQQYTEHLKPNKNTIKNLHIIGDVIYISCISLDTKQIVIRHHRYKPAFL